MTAPFARTTRPRAPHGRGQDTVVPACRAPARGAPSAAGEAFWSGGVRALLGDAGGTAGNDRSVAHHAALRRRVPVLLDEVLARAERDVVLRAVRRGALGAELPGALVGALLARRVVPGVQ